MSSFFIYCVRILNELGEEETRTGITIGYSYSEALDKIKVYYGRFFISIEKIIELSNTLVLDSNMIDFERLNS